MTSIRLSSQPYATQNSDDNRWPQIGEDEVPCPETQRKSLGGEGVKVGTLDSGGIRSRGPNVTRRFRLGLRYY